MTANRCQDVLLGMKFQMISRHPNTISRGTKGLKEVQKGAKRRKREDEKIDVAVV